MAARSPSGDPAEAVAALAGLQAQHANSPYIALWSRVHDFHIGDLEAALAARTVVKGTVMRATLHLVAARDFHALDAASAGLRVTHWTPAAKRAGLDMAALHEDLLAYCHEPRTVAQMEGHLAGIASDARLAEARPTGVRNAAFRLASAGGGLVHVPPSGLWHSHGKPSYIDARVWLPGLDRPDPDEALRQAVVRYLTAYGPASLADLGKWVGQPRVPKVRSAIASLGERIESMLGPEGRELVDLAELDAVAGGVDAPVRFLARWDSALIAYDVRDRILPAGYRDAVIKKNGDFLPAILVDGLVAGLWAADTTRSEAVLTISPFAKIAAATRTDLEAEAERLVRFIEPEATRHAVAWA